MSVSYDVITIKTILQLLYKFFVNPSHIMVSLCKYYYIQLFKKSQCQIMIAFRLIKVLSNSSDSNVT